jgi:hypothetical protein
MTTRREPHTPDLPQTDATATTTTAATAATGCDYDNNNNNNSPVHLPPIPLHLGACSPPTLAAVLPARLSAPVVPSSRRLVASSPRHRSPDHAHAVACLERGNECSCSWPAPRSAVHQSPCHERLHKRGLQWIPRPPWRRQCWRCWRCWREEPPHCRDCRLSHRESRSHEEPLGMTRLLSPASPAAAAEHA